MGSDISLIESWSYTQAQHLEGGRWLVSTAGDTGPLGYRSHLARVYKEHVVRRTEGKGRPEVAGWSHESSVPLSLVISGSSQSPLQLKPEGFPAVCSSRWSWVAGLCIRPALTSGLPLSL